MVIVNIILIALTLIWTIISFFLLHRNQKKIERFKAINAKKNTISKTWFDTEFQMYKELFNELGEVITSIIILKTTSSRMREFRIKYVTTLNKLKSCKPFINTEIYNDFDNLLGDIIRYISQTDDKNPESKGVNMNIIEKKRDNLANKIKGYLSNLTVE